MKIKELEITKEMYRSAKEIEDMYKETKKLDSRSKEFKKLNHKVIELDNKFQKNFSDEFDTCEIVNEYERRETNTEKVYRESEVKNIEKGIAWLINLMNIGILSFLVVNNYSPVYGMIACSVAVITILVAVLPEALKEKEVYNDEI